MSLIVDQITLVLFVGAFEEIIEPHIVKGGCRGERRNMPPYAAVPLIGAHHHSQCIPAHDASDLPLHEHIAGHALFIDRRNRIAVGRNYRGDWDIPPHAYSRVVQFVDKKMRPVDAFLIHYRLKRVQPLSGFFWIRVVLLCHVLHPVCFFGYWR